MRILMTSPYPIRPEDSGAGRRTSSLARSLAALGHDVTVLGAGAPSSHEEDGVRWRGFRPRSGLGHFFNRQFVLAYRSLLDEGPELVVASYPYQAWLLMRPALERAIPLVYDAHNVEADRFRQMGRPLVSIGVRLAEGRLCRAARAVLSVSPEDQELLLASYGVDAVLLPNGVDTRAFTPAPPDGALLRSYGLEGRTVVLFFGTLSYRPNREALDHLHREVWPRIRGSHPEARLLVVGKNPPESLQGESGIVTTGVVDDIVAHLRLANLVVAPLSSGGGTRLKILEALACGQTVLSTPFGAQGLVTDGCRGIDLAELSSFGDRLAELLDDPPRPGESSAAREAALAFDWRTLVRRVDWRSFAGRRS